MGEFRSESVHHKLNYSVVAEAALELCVMAIYYIVCSLMLWRSTFHTMYDKSSSSAPVLPLLYWTVDCLCTKPYIVRPAIRLVLAGDQAQLDIALRMLCAGAGGKSRVSA